MRGGNCSVWSAPSPRPSISKSSQKAADPTAPSRSPIRRRQRRRQSPGVAGHVSSSAPGPSVPGPSGAAVAITASGNTGGTWVVEGLDSAVAQPGLAAQPQQQHRHAASSPYPPPHALRATEGELPPVPDLRMNTAGAHLLPSTLLPPPLNRSRTIRSDVQSAGRQSSRSSRASRRSRTPRLEAQPHPAPHAYWGPSYGAQATTDAMRDHR